MGMSIEEAIKKNPFDPTKGNKSAYCRYLRYNVKGWYNLDSKEVFRRWREEIAIKELTNFKDEYWDGISEEVIDVAIETIRKCQKIEQIVDSRPIGNNAEEKAYNYMMMVKDIKEVLEDGKID